MSLRHTQEVFCRAIRAGQGKSGVHQTRQLFKEGGRLSVEERLSIYRNTGLSARVSALQQIYPVYRSILGTRSFDRLARDFAHGHIPSCADLNLYGETFSDFTDRAIQRLEPLKAYAYLGDLARLEWLWHAVHYRTNDPAFDFRAFELHSQQPAKLKFRLSHSLELMSSDFPVYGIWTGHRGNRPPSTIAGLTSRQYLCIFRPQFKAQVRIISSADYAFLDASRRGNSLAELASDTRTAPAMEHLTSFIERGWISASTLQEVDQEYDVQ